MQSNALPLVTSCDPRPPLLPPATLPSSAQARHHWILAWLFLLAKGRFPQATPPRSSLSPNAITGGSSCSAITLLLSGRPSLSSPTPQGPFYGLFMLW
ncbi:hypothetical protein GOP47_0015361 [Adiantum capillus-veneris]|uniref:Uncharacterized protein n=1 Tax=Adiantum capillus-veneris TaxID=13818 RepID=A0A9D4UJL9_ADICA|nr:hypothetical protein GOP47_0015361 [Adiantum capillus-veneris]